MSDDEQPGEIVVYEPQPAATATLFHTDDPSEVIERATATADALVRIVRDPKRGLISNISGREYPKVECWTLLGTMLGVFPVCVWSRPLVGQDGRPLGWEARVEAHTLSGAIVGAAEAECLFSERNWSRRDSYALRSMAQTRATSKALRLPLGFVMTLAGIEATPAEEMPFAEPAADTPNPVTATGSANGKATKAQITELTQLVAEMTAQEIITAEQFELVMRTEFNVTDPAKLTKDAARLLIERLRAKYDAALPEALQPR